MKPRKIVTLFGDAASGRRCRLKLIIAIIQHHKLDEVRDALAALGVHGMTITEVNGFGRQKGLTEIYRGSEFPGTYVPKLKIEIGIANSLEKEVVAAISNSANTGRSGDGIIFVHNVDRAVRIRTGETDNDAL